MSLLLVVWVLGVVATAFVIIPGIIMGDPSVRWWQLVLFSLGWPAFWIYLIWRAMRPE